MGRRYSVSGPLTVTTTARTGWVLGSTTAVRPRIYDILLGTDPATTTLSDTQLRSYFQRNTDTGTVSGGSSFTPPPLDPGDPACATTANIGYASGAGFSAEPTYTANKVLLDIAYNMRSSQRWQANDRSELVLPATASNGVGWLSLHASITPVLRSTVLFEE